MECEEFSSSVTPNMTSVSKYDIHKCPKKTDAITNRNASDIKRKHEFKDRKFTKKTSHLKVPKEKTENVESFNVMHTSTEPKCDLKDSSIQDSSEAFLEMKSNFPSEKTCSSRETSAKLDVKEKLLKNSKNEKSRANDESLLFSNLFQPEHNSTFISKKPVTIASKIQKQLQKPKVVNLVDKSDDFYKIKTKLKEIPKKKHEIKRKVIKKTSNLKVSVQKTQGTKSNDTVPTSSITKRGLKRNSIHNSEKSFNANQERKLSIVSEKKNISTANSGEADVPWKSVQVLETKKSNSKDQSLPSSTYFSSSTFNPLKRQKIHKAFNKSDPCPKIDTKKEKTQIKIEEKIIKKKSSHLKIPIQKTQNSKSNDAMPTSSKTKSGNSSHSSSKSLNVNQEWKSNSMIRNYSDEAARVFIDALFPPDAYKPRKRQKIRKTLNKSDHCIKSDTTNEKTQVGIKEKIKSSYLKVPRLPDSKKFKRSKRHKLTLSDSKKHKHSKEHKLEKTSSSSSKTSDLDRRIRKILTRLVKKVDKRLTYDKSISMAKGECSTNTFVMREENVSEDTVQPKKNENSAEHNIVNDELIDHHNIISSSPHSLNFLLQYFESLGSDTSFENEGKDMFDDSSTEFGGFSPSDDDSRYFEIFEDSSFVFKGYTP